MNKTLDLRNVLSDVYGLNPTPVGRPLHVDLSAVTVYTHYPDKYTVENYGKFDMQQFQAGPDELYNLVVFEGDFTTNERLFEAMRDEEERDVKDYELVNQNKTLQGYFLYRLIPYTVQGKPTWY